MSVVVWTVLWGDKYHPGYVEFVRRMASQHIPVPHEFRCVTDADLEGIACVRPIMPWEGWWQKIQLFHFANVGDINIYFDLDVLIVRDCGYLLNHYRFGAPSNWAESGWGGVQSSVMVWDGSWDAPFNRFQARFTEHYHGDQDYLTDLADASEGLWTPLRGVGSYKYHCQKGLPERLHVCAFHGLPKPHEVFDEWTLPYTSTLRSLISGSTPSG